MKEINKQLQQYVEEKIFPIYAENDLGHHIKYVIKRSSEFANQFKNIDFNMVYVIASFHDLAHHIDKNKYEFIS